MHSTYSQNSVRRLTSFRVFSINVQFFFCVFSKCSQIVPHVISATYWQRINANGWAPNDLFSWKNKKNGYIMNTTSHFLEDIQLLMVTIFSLCWPLILLYHVRNGFPSTASHVFFISAGFQLTLFHRVGRARPLTPSVRGPVPGSSGSRQLPVSLSGTQIPLNIRKGIIFITAFKGTLPQWTLFMCTTGPKTHKEKLIFFALTWPKSSFCVLWQYPEWPSNFNISANSNLYPEMI